MAIGQMLCKWNNGEKNVLSPFFFFFQFAVISLDNFIMGRERTFFLKVYDLVLPP